LGEITLLAKKFRLERKKSRVRKPFADAERGLYESLRTKEIREM